MRKLSAKQFLAWAWMGRRPEAFGVGFRVLPTVGKPEKSLPPPSYMLQAPFAPVTSLNGILSRRHCMRRKQRYKRKSRQLAPH